MYISVYLQIYHIINFRHKSLKWGTKRLLMDVSCIPENYSWSICISIHLLIYHIINFRHKSLQSDPKRLLVEVSCILENHCWSICISIYLLIYHIINFQHKSLQWGTRRPDGCVLYPTESDIIMPIPKSVAELSQSNLWLCHWISCYN